jgi:ankyrin repeat protein
VNAKNEHGQTPLHSAAYTGDKKIVELLIAEGADLDVKDKDGWAPLNNAVKKGHEKIVELLLDKGANVNILKSWQTPLDLAKHELRFKIADLLRKHGGKTAKELKAEGK